MSLVKTYRLFRATPQEDKRGIGSQLYLTKKCNIYYIRIYLLTSGELSLIDYVDYGEGVPQDVVTGKKVGVGVPHYILSEVESFSSALEVANYSNTLKEELLVMSKVLIKYNDTSGYYELVQGKDIDDIFEAAKV